MECSSQQEKIVQFPMLRTFQILLTSGGDPTRTNELITNDITKIRMISPVWENKNIVWQFLKEG